MCLTVSRTMIEERERENALNPPLKQTILNRICCMCLCIDADFLQVLMQTIEREPPSLKSYPDDRQPGGEVFGRNFKEVRPRPSSPPFSEKTKYSLKQSLFLKRLSVRFIDTTNEIITPISNNGETNQISPPSVRQLFLLGLTYRDIQTHI